MSVPLILRNFFTGETSGGSFTLTSLTQYPNTIFVSGGTGNVTFNSASDLPYTVPTGYVASVTVTTPGVYTFDYCVDSCPSAVCSTVDITIIDKPIIGTAPTIYRCGVNGVYNNINVCYGGSITNNSNGLPYSGTLSSFTWSKGAWSATGNCVTIPTSVSAGTITLTATTTGGTCVSTNTVTLTDVNIYAGNTGTKTLCLDKHQIETYKNTPSGFVATYNLNLLYTGFGELTPLGSLTTWSFVSGPATIPMTNNVTANFSNTPIGTYTFKRKVTYGSCSSETIYTLVVKYCTRGDQVNKISTYCKLNTTMVMSTAYANLLNPNYSPITNGGCWYYLGGSTNLDIEINGTLYTNLVSLSCFPYNATIKIVSSGNYEFEYNDGSVACGSPGGCTYVSNETLCGCDYFLSGNEAGTFVIDTTGAAPNAGASKILAMGCGSRQVSLYSKFNQLNGGNVTGGGVWTYQGVTAPVTFLVNGTSMSFNIGDTIPGSDPLVDLTGLPNPSNYSFKYTVTNTCGTANKNLTVNITCNDCNKTIDTTYTKTDCVNTYSILHPVTLAVNQVRVTVSANSIFATADWIQRISTCEGTNTDISTDFINYATLEYKQIGTAPTNGTYIKSLKLWSSTTGFVTLNLDPTTTPYLTGCAGTVVAADLYVNLLSLSTYRVAFDKLLRNAICTAFGGAVINTNYKYQLNISSGGLTIRFNAVHSPSVQWICLNDSSGSFIYNKGGVDFTVTTVSKAATGPTIRVLYNGGLPSFCESFWVYSQNASNPLKGINVAASTMTNLVLLSSVDDVTPDITDPLYKPTTTCKKWNFNTTISPACSGTPTYSYKVGGVSIPDNTATFIRKTNSTECNPFNSGLSQSLETTVVCDGCTYVKTPITFC